jgi:hypothetical protein
MKGNNLVLFNMKNKNKRQSLIHSQQSLKYTATLAEGNNSAEEWNNL